jgi:AAA domain
VWQYQISGLSVASEIVLPGTSLQRNTGEHDVLVRRGLLPTHLEGATSQGPGWAFRNSTYLFEVPALARFLVSDGREIVVDVDQMGDERDASIFVLGTAFSILLHQRGHLVLHGSAVAVDGKVVVFCGPSGAGKSTLAASLMNKDYAFVNDDTCHVRFGGDGKPVVFPDGTPLKLRADAVESLSLGARKGAAVHSSNHKFFVSPAREAQASARQLAAIYVLTEAPASGMASILRPSLLESVALLRQNAYRPNLIDALNMEERYFQDTARLLSNVGVFRLVRTVAFSATPLAVHTLEAHWRELGLIPREQTSSAPK